MIVAGEASGDLHAANMFKAMQAQQADLIAYGMGGKRMREAGIEITQDMETLSVMGLVEVIKKYPSLKRALNKQIRIAKQRKPDLLILIDFQEFNKKLAKALKGSGTKVLFYVSPQVWAWRPHRAAELGQYIDMMACIFPFELPYYEQAKVPARFVGHPIVDEVELKFSREQAHERYQCEHQHPVITMMPGSRRSEVERLMPVMMDSASLIQKCYPDACFLLPRASSIDATWLQSMIPAELKEKVSIVEDGAYDAANISEVVIVASGTAALEIAIIGTPMIVVYKMSSLSFWILSKLVKTRWVSLPNILMGKEVVRELLQDDATPMDICQEMSRILEEKPYNEQMRRNLAEVKTRLGSHGASNNVANLALEMLE